MLFRSAHLQQDGIRFTIAGYQRGFRWTRAEVRDLLDDVREFSLAHPAESGAFYCLQPLVVTSAPDGSWTVIDGQQRLTTLYLFYCCCSWMLPPSARYNLLPFSLRYVDRPRSSAEAWRRRWTISGSPRDELEMNQLRFSIEKRS